MKEIKIDQYIIRDTEKVKIIDSDNLHCVFSKITGETVTWGRTMREDPDWSPPGPFILDCEISTICHGPEDSTGKARPCPQCYKSNTPFHGKNMSLETWKIILSKMPKTLQQVAFGLGDIDGNPNLWNILIHTREQGIVPNITINGSRMSLGYLTYPKTVASYRNLAGLCGAVAVSLYDRAQCYKTVETLFKEKGNIEEATLQQINIHQVLHEESLSACFQTLIDIKEARTNFSHPLHNLNAVVFLSLKPKGKRNNLTVLRDKKKYQKLIDFAMKNELPIGFDSCGASWYEESIRSLPESKYEAIMTSVESCESTLFSSYINVDGDFFPCSFTEGTPNWETGISVTEATDFGEVWNHPRTTEFRKKLISTMSNGCRSCPIYDLKFTKLFEENGNNIR